MANENERPADPMGILLPTRGLSKMPYLVTMQAQFRVDAASQDKAEAAILNHTSFGAILMGGMVTIGVTADPLTAELMAALKEQMTGVQRG